MSKEIERVTPTQRLVKTAGPVMLVCLAGVTGGILFHLFLPLFMLFIVLCGGATLKAIEGAIKKDVKQVAAKDNPEVAAAQKVKALMESTDIVRAPQNEYECRNYEQVIWEMKLVEEKVIPISDVSVCDMDGCFLCTPIRAKQALEAKRLRDEEIRAARAIHEANMREIRDRQKKRANESDQKQLDEMTEAQRYRVEVWSRLRYEETVCQVGKWSKETYVTKTTDQEPSKCKTCPSMTMLADYCPKCSLARLEELDEQDKRQRKAAAAAAKKAAAEEKKRQFELRRHMVCEGVNVTRPLSVPEGAVPSILHGRDIDPFATHSFVVWKWTEDGKNTLFFKQPILIDAMTVQNGNGHVVKSLYSVYDPDTNEYLGDYRVINGKTEAVHNAELMKNVKMNKRASAPAISTSKVKR